MARLPRTAGAAKPAPIGLAASSIEIAPLTPERWPDVTALFDEGGDPRTCWHHPHVGSLADRR